MGGHKFEGSLNYKGRSCLKGKKGTENGSEKEGRQEERTEMGKGKTLHGRGKSPVWISCPCRAGQKSGSF